MEIMIKLLLYQIEITKEIFNVLCVIRICMKKYIFLLFNNSQTKTCSVSYSDFDYVWDELDPRDV